MKDIDLELNYPNHVNHLKLLPMITSISQPDVIMYDSKDIQKF